MWKPGLKTGGSPCYFLSSRGQKIKNITKIEHTRLFLFPFLVSFFMGFLTQKLIYAINKWFNFVPGSFFEQGHLLNLRAIAYKEILRWDHWPLGFSLFLHMLQGTMGGSFSQNLSILPFTVTEILQFEKCVKCRPGIYRPEFKMLITLVHFVIISSNLVSRLLFIISNKRNPCF